MLRLHLQRKFVSFDFRFDHAMVVDVTELFSCYWEAKRNLVEGFWVIR